MLLLLLSIHSNSRLHTCSDGPIYKQYFKTKSVSRNFISKNEWMSSSLILIILGWRHWEAMAQVPGTTQYELAFLCLHVRIPMHQQYSSINRFYQLERLYQKMPLKLVTIPSHPVQGSHCNIIIQPSKGQYFFWNTCFHIQSEANSVKSLYQLLAVTFVF